MESRPKNNIETPPQFEFKLIAKPADIPKDGALDLAPYNDALKSGPINVFYSGEGKPVLGIHLLNPSQPENRPILLDGMRIYVKELPAYIFTDDFEAKLKSEISSVQNSSWFLKVYNDEKRVYELSEKKQKGEDFDSADLRFLYGVDSKVLDFKNYEHPRVPLLLDGRDVEVDLPKVFDCDNTQIARAIGDINYNTKVYIGDLINLSTSDLKKLSEIEYVYTDFPKNRVWIDKIEAEGESAESLKTALQKTTFSNHFYDSAKIALAKIKPTEKREVVFLRSSLKSLGLSDTDDTSLKITLEDVKSKAKNLGLEICPLELGIQYSCMKAKLMPEGDFVYFASSDSDVLNFGIEDYRPSLNNPHFSPIEGFNSEDQFLFILKKQN